MYTDLGSFQHGLAIKELARCYTKTVLDFR